MAKRFITTEIFKDSWFMDLPSKYKLFWLFLLTDCTHAGIWQINYKVAAFYVGDHLEPGECERIFKERIVKIDNGKYWFIPKFIEFQYGTVLSKSNNALNSVIDSLIKHNLLQYLPNITIREANKQQVSSSSGAKDKEKEKDKVKEGEKDIEGVVSSQIDNIWQRSFGRNPKEPEREETEFHLKKYGFEKTLKLYKDAVNSGIKTIRTLNERCDTNGNFIPYMNKNITDNQLSTKPAAHQML